MSGPETVALTGKEDGHVPSDAKSLVPPSCPRHRGRDRPRRRDASEPPGPGLRRRDRLRRSGLRGSGAVLLRPVRLRLRLRPVLRLPGGWGVFGVWRRVPPSPPLALAITR